MACFVAAPRPFSFTLSVLSWRIQPVCTLVFLCAACSSESTNEDPKTAEARGDDAGGEGIELASEDADSADPTQQPLHEEPNSEPAPSDSEPGDAAVSRPFELGDAGVSTGPGDFEADFASSTDYFSLTGGLRPALSTSPHGRVQIFYSSNLRPLVDEEWLIAPPGSVAIKNQDSDGDGVVDVVMVMIKGEDDGSGAGRWRYQQRTPAGKLTLDDSPKLDFCATCHELFAATDSLGGFTLRD
jgi:hypothetical protein